MKFSNLTDNYSLIGIRVYTNVQAGNNIDGSNFSVGFDEYVERAKIVAQSITLSQVISNGYDIYDIRNPMIGAYTRGTDSEARPFKLDTVNNLVEGLRGGDLYLFESNIDQFENQMSGTLDTNNNTKDQNYTVYYFDITTFNYLGKGTRDNPFDLSSLDISTEAEEGGQEEVIKDAYEEVDEEEVDDEEAIEVYEEEANEESEEETEEEETKIDSTIIITSLKIEKNFSNVLAGQILPNIVVNILNSDNEIVNILSGFVHLDITNLENIEVIKRIRKSIQKGASIFNNIMLTKTGIYNFKFSYLDMILTTRIRVLASKKLFIRNSFNRNTLIKSVPTESLIKLQLEDIYGNKVDSKTQISVYVKNDNKNIKLFGNIIEYRVSIVSIKGVLIFSINEEISPRLSFNLGNTYIFDLRETLQRGFVFRLSSTPDGSHNEGSIFESGCNYYQGKLYITVMKNTPKRLYYFCQKYMNMGSEIMISQESVSKQYKLRGSNPLYISNLAVPVKGKIFIYFMSSSNQVKSSSLLLNIVNRPKTDQDKYTYTDYQFDYLLQSSIYTGKLATVNNQKFKPRTQNLVPREAGLTESSSLTYRKNRPQELNSIPVNLDNSKGGTVNNLPVFNPRIRPNFQSSSSKNKVSILNNSTVGLTSGTLINMTKENTIQTGPKSYVVNDVLSLSDILKQKKVNNKPNSDPLKSEVVRVV